MYVSYMNHEYRVVKIPDELYRKAEKIIGSSNLGYRTVSEFVIEAVRRRVEELETKQEVEVDA